MDWLHVVVLAIIQGITEFLPISSSGHLVLPAQLLGWPDQGLAFDVAVHVGSLLAVLWYFRHDVAKMISAWFLSVAGREQSGDSRLAWNVIIGTLPVGVIGLLCNDIVEQHLRGIGVIATSTIVFGVLLGLADRNVGPRREILDIGWRIALVIGFAQALALIPGTSRSGITITAALFLGLTRDGAARFSFLLSIPAILAAGGLKTVELLEIGASVPWLQILAGTGLSAVTAYLCIYWFMLLLDRIGMMPFVIYRLILGGALLFLM
jgi:undecaprenyl-diphosphatase